jgi:hypothetical protein
LAELIVAMGVTRRHPQRLHSLLRFYQTDMARQKSAMWRRSISCM